MGAVLVAVIAFVVTAAILVVVFAAIRRRIASDVARLRDVELDSGPTRMTTRYRGFRSERILRRDGVRRNPARVVLTATHLHLLERPQYYGVFERSDLARFTVGRRDGRLHLWSDDPPDATGTIDYRIDVADPDVWVRALVRAGARPHG